MTSDTVPFRFVIENESEAIQKTAIQLDCVAYGSEENAVIARSGATWQSPTIQGQLA
jgi:hypothetical protein